MRFAIVEKANELAVHQIFSSKESAERFLAETTPIYCKRGYYTDKTLTTESFIVVPYSSK